MRLIYPKPPPRIRDLAYQALNMELLRHPHENAGAEPRVHENATGHVPDLHKVFLLQAADVAKKKDLKAAKLTGWYDVMVLSGISHGIEVAQPRGSAAAVSIARGAEVDDQLAILTELANMKQPRQVEVRVLRIPWIAPFSYWLHGGRRGSDRLIPVISSSPRLQRGRQYAPSEFFKAIREPAVHLARNAQPPVRSKSKLRPKKNNSVKTSRRAAAAKPNKSSQRTVQKRSR
jgi:hypothetical protein